MNITARHYKDKSFTVVSYACVLLLGVLLLVVLVPMIGRGLAAVFFKETIEFRRMQYAIFDRGSEERLKADVAAVEAARRPIYELVDSFSRGIDTQSQIDRARDIYRQFGDELRLKNVDDDTYSDLRGKAKEMRNALTAAYESTDPAEVRASLDQVLAFADDPAFKGTAVQQYFEMARAYGKTIERIDLTDRQRYAAQLDEVKEALRKLFGPRPQEEMPPLAENQFGATRWDLVRRHLRRLLYAETWVQTDPAAPMEKKLVPRTDPSQFGGTELEPLFGMVENNLDALFLPRPRIYWQYFIDDSTPGHFFGGIGPEILGTLLLTVCAMAFAAPLGIVSAAYLVEFGGDSRLVRLIRTCINTLAGVPSIVFGLFGLAFYVMIVGRPCVLTTSLTLGLLVLPVIICASEEAIRAVPRTYIEASLALGAGRFKTFITVTLPAALPGILTGIILSLSRAAGETAPILFTGAVFLGPIPNSLFDKTRALSYASYGIATGDKVGMTMPHQQYGVVMTLIVLVLLLNLAAIAIRWRVSRKLKGY